MTHKITKSAQKAIANALIEFAFAESMEDVYKHLAQMEIRDKSKLSQSAKNAVSALFVKFSSASTIDEFREMWNTAYQEYGLCDDPFTRLPIAPDEYEKNRLEYDRQLMYEKYGHYDGLE